jgi:hypothetical protein
MSVALPGVSDETTASALLAENAETEQRGLFLTEREALELARTRRQALGAVGRVEIGVGAVEKIMRVFSNSAYLRRENYASVLNELVEAFYELKNESDDRISDDDLIRFLYDEFEHKSGGSLAFLQSRELNHLLRTLRFGAEYETETGPEEKEEEDEDD